MTTETPSGAGSDAESTREMPTADDPGATSEAPSTATTQVEDPPAVVPAESTREMSPAEASPAQAEAAPAQAEAAPAAKGTPTAKGAGARASAFLRKLGGRASGDRETSGATQADVRGPAPEPAPAGSAQAADPAASQAAAAAGPSRTPHAASVAASAAGGAPPPVQHQAAAAPRRVRLALSRVDPWSVMKLSFLLSIAAGIALVVATAVVWNVLNTMEVFTILDELIRDIAGTESFINILEYVEFSRILSISVVVAVVDVVLLTALATLGAFLYNIVAALVGGLHVTLTDE